MSDEILVFYENEAKPIKDITGLDLEELLSIRITRKEYLKKNSDQGEYVFIRIGNVVRAQGYIGFTFINGREVVVLPKIAEENNSNNNKDLYDGLNLMLTMIYYALGMGITKYAESIIDSIKGGLRKELGFYDLLAFLYARTLLKELYRGAYHSYKYTISEEKRIKGRIILSKQLLKPPHKQLNITIRYARYGIDNLLNNIFFYASIQALKYAKHRINKKLLREILLLLDEAYVKTLDPTSLDQIVFTRNNTRFKPAFTLARIILDAQRTLTSGEKIYGLFLDSSMIFERIVYNTLRGLKGYIVEYQRELSKEAKSLVHNYQLKMIPDIIIRENSEIKLLIDVKYKKLIDKNGFPKIANEDLYQVYTYMRALQLYNKKNNCTTGNKGEKIVLIYPKYKEFNKDLKKTTIEFKDGNKIIILPYTIESPERIIDKTLQQEILKLIE